MSEAGRSSPLNIYPKSLEYINNHLIDSFIKISWARNRDILNNYKIILASPTIRHEKLKTQGNTLLASHTVINIKCAKCGTLSLPINGVQEETGTNWC